MKKYLILLLSAVLTAGTAVAGYAAEYDRYERGYKESAPPPPRKAAPVPRQHARYGEPYLFGNIGVYDPNSDSDGLKGYDAGYNFGLGIGYRISPIFAVEGGIGAFGAEDGGNDVTVVPVTVGARLILPNPSIIEPYLGAGVGLYFTSLEETTYFEGGGHGKIDDDETEFGGYFSVGADFWLNPRLALTAEAKYQWVDATFTSNAGNDFDVDLSGWMFNFGVRLSF